MTNDWSEIQRMIIDEAFERASSNQFREQEMKRLEAVWFEVEESESPKPPKAYGALIEAVLWCSSNDWVMPDWVVEVFHDMIEAAMMGKPYDKAWDKHSPLTQIRALNRHYMRYRKVEVELDIQMLKDQKKSIEQACESAEEKLRGSEYHAGVDTIKKSYYAVLKDLEAGNHAKYYSSTHRE